MIDEKSEEKLRKLAAEPCEAYTHGSCLTDSGRSADAQYSADRYCPTCLLKDALGGFTEPPEDNTVTIHNVLEIELDPERTNTLTPISIKQYFQKIIFTLWEDPESFSGKRPFGDSGWAFDIICTVEEKTRLTYTESKLLLSKALTSLFN